ncbi:predicted protein [Chaetoceros tenuissimus]|uniref:MYND-type domain-containing protein n=1 Tax=Chaetoceros tenuissimus TaxID=426638 RepID=A0AAD3CLM7_9STRA|nr:predicted protein [Chaetoceros tenuissimus]
MPSRKKKAGRRRLESKGTMTGGARKKKNEIELEQKRKEDEWLRDAAQRFDSILSSDEELKALEEFILWSLSDKIDLTTKKFEKIALAKMLLEGRVSKEDLVMKRAVIISRFEDLSKELELIATVNILVTSLDEFFRSATERKGFEEKLTSALLLEQGLVQKNSVMSSYRQKVFQEVASKWFCLAVNEINTCVYYNSSEETFNRQFEDSEKLEIDALARHFKGSEIFKKYFFNTNAREASLEGFYEQKTIGAVLSHHEERWKCWECKELGGKGTQKSQLCASCKCAVYCSRECQMNHWKVGLHKKNCMEICKFWSRYETSKKRIGKALKDERLYTKLLIIGGIEKECWLRPTERVDYLVAQTILLHPPEFGEQAEHASIDIFYKNIATLACGGTHPIFGNETITHEAELQKLISENCDGILPDFNLKEVTEKEIKAMADISVFLMLGRDSEDINWDLVKENFKNNSEDLPVERFIAIYIYYESLNRDNMTVWFTNSWNRFQSEKWFLDQLRVPYKEWMKEDA